VDDCKSAAEREGRERDATKGPGLNRGRARVPERAPRAGERALLLVKPMLQGELDARQSLHPL